MKLNPTARPINAECTVYEVPISTIYGRLSLYVQFPATFPSTAPLIQVTSLVQHPWVDAEMYVVHHPKIHSWSSASSAGQLVADIVAEWTRTPPTPSSVGAAAAEAKTKEREREMRDDDEEHWVVVGSNPGASPMQNTPVNSASSKSARTPSPHPQNGPPPLPQSNSWSGGQTKPSVASASSAASSSSSASSSFSLSLPIPTSFPFLSSLTLAELQQLDSNPLLLHDHLLVLPSSIQLQHIKQDMHSTLQQQTAQTLALQPSYQSSLDHVRRLRAEVDAERQALDELLRRQEAVVSRWSVQGVIRELERGIDEAEKRSEKTRERYMAGREEEEKVEARGAGAPGGAAAGEDEEEKDVSARRGDVHGRFVDSYVKQRTVVHERSAKRERLIEQLQQKGQWHGGGHG